MENEVNIGRKSFLRFAVAFRSRGLAGLSAAGSRVLVRFSYLCYDEHIRFHLRKHSR